MSQPSPKNDYPSIASQTPRRATLIKAPLITAAVALLAGMLAGFYLPIKSPFWIIVAAIAVGVTIVTIIRKHLKLATSICLTVAIAALGAANIRSTAFTRAENHIVNFTDTSAIFATVRGRIISTPMIVSEQGGAGGYRHAPKTCFRLAADEILLGDKWSPTTGDIRVSIDEPAENLTTGQRVELVGKIGRFHSPSNPGQFDAARYAKISGVLTWMSVPTAAGATPAGDDQSWLAKIFWKAQSAARQQIGADVADDDSVSQIGSRLLEAMIIGDRHPSLRTLNQSMMQAGVVHYLSISGSHLAIFLGFVYLLCRLAMLRPSTSAAVALVALAGYVMLATPNAPLIRSAIMAACICLATIFQRRPATLNALATAFIVITVADPMQIFDAGFQLSFAIVAGFILLHKPVVYLIFGRWIKRRGLMVFRGSTRLRRWLNFTLANWFMDGVAISLIAYLISAPLAAYHFGIFSPYAIVLNAILAPLVAAVLIPGYLCLALAWPMPNLSAWLGQLACQVADAIAWIVAKTSSLPAIYVELFPIGIATTLTIFAVMLIPFAPRFKFRSIVIAAAWIVAVGLFVTSQLPAAAPTTAELHLLDVGPGQCALLRTPSGKTFLFDAGTRGSFDAYDQSLAPFLRAMKFPAPRQAFVSHANSDHYNAIGRLIESGKIEKLYLNGYFSPASGISPDAVKLLADADAAGVQIIRLHAGQTIQLDDRTKVEALWPPMDHDEFLATPAGANDSSLVLRITCDDKSVLLTGDVAEYTQRRLMGVEIQADAMILPHHGSLDKTSGKFATAVGAKILLESAARPPGQMSVVYAGQNTGEKYLQKSSILTGKQFYSTPTNGWIRIHFGGGKLDVTTAK